MFTPLHSSANQELFEKYICNQSSHYAEIRWCHVPQLSSETEVSIALLCQLCSTRYTAVQIKMKSTSVIKVATMKNTDDFSLCTYQCNARLPQVRTEVGGGVGICILENYNFPLGKHWWHNPLHSPTSLPVMKPRISVGLLHDRNVCFLGNDKSPPPWGNLAVHSPINSDLPPPLAHNCGSWALH